jgi:para-aminobenzoate synthetase/4-amino-4-deoxychorismate lyase
VHALPIDRMSVLVACEPCCIILDNARPSREQRYSFIFTRPYKTIACSRLCDVRPALAAISREASRSWIAGYLAYEVAYGLEGKFFDHIDQGKRHRNDLIWFGVFDEPYRFDHLTGSWNRKPVDWKKEEGHARGLEAGAEVSLGMGISRTEYGRSVSAIKKLIAAGDVYQVNYTFEAALTSRLRPWNLYRALRRLQPVPFGAFFNTGRSVIASLSPELFFMRNGRRIIARPMKGTAPRGRYWLEDAAIAHALSCDPKNKSENVMIVDLLRNDLGRICETGSIRVDRLFEVEQHPTLHQMTSTVAGTLRKNIGFYEMIGALFPGGSVTGAPKIRAMEVIRSIEKTCRGVYCGAIGYSSPTGRAVFSIPIRTLTRETGRAVWHYGVGSGIVWDSDAQKEWRECMNKCGFLTRRDQPFQILESMLFTRNVFLYRREHCSRMAEAAQYFGYPFDRKRWDAIIAAIKTRLRSHGNASKVRILLDSTGVLSWDYEAIRPLAGAGTPIVLLSKTPVRTGSPFLFHKTTIRPWYDKAMQLVRSGACFDVLHTNERGELTEGARTNLFVTIRGILYTPPVECGLLPGVLRKRLLASKKCAERVLRPADFRKAEAVYCGNSVRGLVRVRTQDRI